MSDLLPPNATAQERALSDATARIADVPVVVREMWNPGTCPANLLGWLAWAVTVDEWATGWSDAQKRETIKRSIAVHRYKGTIGAVQEDLGALSYRARVQEWFNQIPAGPAYTFALLLDVDQVGVMQSDIQTVLALVERTKNLRSHLSSSQITVSTAANPRIGGATFVGSEVTVSFGSSPIVASQSTIIV